MTLFQKFVKNSAIYGVATMLARGVSFLLLPLYTRALSPADYGISDLLSTLIGLAGIVLTVEIGQGLYRFYPEAQDEQQKTNYTSTAFWFTAVIYGLFLIVCLSFSSQLARVVLHSPTDSRFIVIASLTLPIYGLYNLSMLVLQCRFQAVQYGITNLVLTVVALLVSILTVLVLRMGIAGVLIGNAVGYLFGLALSVYYARQNYRWAFHPRQLKEMLSFSIPLVPSSLGYFATLYINRLALSILLTLTDVGLFSIAYRLVSPIGLIMTALSSSLTPLIYANYRSEETPAAIARIFRIVFAGCLILTLGLSLFAREALFLLTTPDYFPAAILVPVLTVSAVFSGLYLFTTGLVIAKKTTIIAVINILSGLLNIGLNWVLIPYLGVFGAGLATCLSVMINFFISMYYSQKYYRVPISWWQVGVASLFTLIAIGIGLTISTISWWGILLKGLIVLSVCGFLLYVGLVQVNELKTLVNSVKSKLFALRAPNSL